MHVSARYARRRLRTGYAGRVFINCPFNAKYRVLFNAIVFTVHDCGFVARCALERVDSAEVRIDKIVRLIGNCQFGIHDLSRTEVDPVYRLPRFNMPLELGLFLGAQRYGIGQQRRKACLVLDRDPHRYQRFCSDIAGQDPTPHGGDPVRAIRAVRDWLQHHAATRMPSGAVIAKRYEAFCAQLPWMCKMSRLRQQELTFHDFTYLVAIWLKYLSDTDLA